MPQLWPLLLARRAGSMAQRRWTYAEQAHGVMHGKTRGLRFQR